MLQDNNDRSGGITHRLGFGRGWGGLSLRVAEGEVASLETGFDPADEILVLVGNCQSFQFDVAHIAFCLWKKIYAMWGFDHLQCRKIFFLENSSTSVFFPHNLITDQVEIKLFLDRHLNSTCNELITDFLWGSLCMSGIPGAMNRSYLIWTWEKHNKLNVE